MDRLGFPCGTLTKPIWEWILARRQLSLRLIGLLEVRFVVGISFLDRLAGWLDRLHDLMRSSQPGEIALRATASPPSKIPTSLRRCSLSKVGGTGIRVDRYPDLSPKATVGRPDFENQVAPQGKHGVGLCFGGGAGDGSAEDRMWGRSGSVNFCAEVRMIRKDNLLQHLYPLI